MAQRLEGEPRLWALKQIDARLLDVARERGECACALRLTWIWRKGAGERWSGRGHFVGGLAPMTREIPKLDTLLPTLYYLLLLSDLQVR